MVTSLYSCAFRGRPLARAPHGRLYRFANAAPKRPRPADEGEIKPRLPLDATLHREQYRCDEELERLIAEYDEVQSAWYRQRHMHPTEPRWSAVMSGRLPAVTKRAGIGRFLREQGLNTL